MTDSSSPDLASRLGELRIGLRSDLSVTRHLLQGEPVYTVHDALRFVSHQLSARDYQVFVAITGQTALGTVFRSLIEQGVLSDEQEDEFYSFVVYLNQLGLLDVPNTDGKNLYARWRQTQRARRRRLLTSWLFMRVPFLSPDAFLERALPFVRPLFTRTAALLWCMGALGCLLLMSLRWEEFAAPLATLATTVELPTLVVTLVCLKVVHEFGHAFACKRFGGHVPEMGAYFLVFTPCAYVDASAAWSFRRRRDRIAVSLAGVYAESLVAMIALVYWWMSEPSWYRSVAHYVVVLSSLTTIGFNINPLMRYDGYYVLADLVNMPNLRAESMATCSQWAKAWLFGVNGEPSSRTKWMRLGLGLYGVAASVYRVFVIGGLLMLLVLRLPGLGLAVAGVVIVLAIGNKLRNLVYYLWRSEELLGRRRRAVCVSVVGSALAAVLLLVIHWPQVERAEGLVARSGDVLVRAQTDGFLREAYFQEGQPIKRNELICELENDALQAQALAESVRLKTMSLQVMETVGSPDGAALIEEQRRAVAEDQAGRLSARVDSLFVRAPASGWLLATTPLESAGGFVREGDLLGRISRGDWVLETVVRQSDFARLNVQLGQQISVRLAGARWRAFQGSLQSISHSAEVAVTDPRLSARVGGPLETDPRGQLSNEPYFRLRVRIDDPEYSQIRHGMQGYACLPCHAESMGTRFLRLALRFLVRVRLAA